MQDFTSQKWQSKKKMQTTYDLDEDVFAVEKIISHRIRNGTTQYLIKWEGFGSEDNSWENEGNVYAPILIRKYWNKSRNKVKIPNKRKQNITNSPVDDSNLSNGAINSNMPTRTRDTSGSQFSDRVDAINNVCSEDCWENLATISDVFLDYSTSQLLMLLIWNNGTKSYHTAQEVHRKCPRQLIKFYEGNLHFENGHKMQNEN
ncbi:chromobox protein [Gigaspora margarita]|uniref:Chromobox protein n=1 Tax=Gigaspora margarita TaxID=4874 RepID=A0A8H4EHD6_GIGMA|nr:chromobox protein [Gigaspora margarita]